MLSIRDPGEIIQTQFALPLKRNIASPKAKRAKSANCPISLHFIMLLQNGQ